MCFSLSEAAYSIFQSNKKDVEDRIKRYLKNSIDRNGGRDERKRKSTSNIDAVKAKKRCSALLFDGSDSDD